MIVAIKTYQFVFSSLLSQVFALKCRFTPTCSQYAEEAMRTMGFLKGSILTIRRLSRCHPFGSSGYDPININKG